METEQDIKQLALRYFRGEISRPDESHLFDFLKQDISNREKLRNWEQEWIATESASCSDKEWKSLERRMKAIEAINQHEFIPKRRSLWRPISAVAAVALILISTSVAIKYYIASEKPNLHHFTTEAPKGERSKIVLPDGTTVLLNAGSKLNYSNEFNDKNRKVELVGEGYFEVTKKDGNKFTVHTRGYDVVVKGTKFDVAAYPQDSLVTTTLIEGKVELNYQNRVIAMLPGQTMSLNTNTNTIKQLSTQTWENSGAWVENRIEYDDITLKQLASILSIQYNVEIHIGNKRLEGKTFNISLRNKENIQEIMNVISELTHTRISYKEKDIYIY
jgi:ferric-dicitrate binding protein FerR (iron transport regulator)